MKYIKFLLIGLWLFTACNQTRTESADAPETEESLVDGPGLSTQEDKAASSARENVTQDTPLKEKTSFDFLTDCEELDTWIGAIQGVSQAETSDLYLMGQCFSNRHYDLLVFSKRKISMQEGVDSRKGTIKAGISGAEYYAFEIPKREVKDPEDGIEPFEYVFPSEVKVYQLLDGAWYQIAQQRVNSFEELGRLKLKATQRKLNDTNA